MGKIITGNYATVELTKVASRKTGEIEAQCALADEFNGVLENGAIVYIDAATDTIVSAYDKAKTTTAYLHFSNPRRYGELESGMAHFRYEENDDCDTFGVKLYPRLFKLTSGDLFRTDYDLSAHVGKEIVEVTGGVLAGVTTMPNGKPGKLYRVL